MVIQYCSDLHLEFRENDNYLKNYPLEPRGEILLLAGDIVPFDRMHRFNDFFDRLSDQFQQTYWVPGNHEYYHSDITERSGTIQEKIRSNVWLVNNLSVEQDDVRFIFSTLWSNISPVNQSAIQRFMADFHVISKDGNPFTSLDFNALHETCKLFITTELEKKDFAETIVVTHHVPTFMHYPEKYKGDALNEAFAAELSDVIEPSGVTYWIFGHHHQPVEEFQIGATRLINNQLGYVRYQEHKNFHPGKTFLI